jgi:uncharacterized protein YjbJ (UPF0337 family)
MSSDATNPSLISGHAQYAKGAITETVGNVTGSQEWQESGKNDAQAGIEQMKVISALPNPLNQICRGVLTDLSLYRQRLSRELTNQQRVALGAE